ncbi:MAG: amino acid ABC transporter permease [Clostridiales Family XIII bacterium]|jgi:His/Glu/Gln/Arg/opine family amino acid ABC transporter permease subunit|nr:amino acid ABC transporter permease [Clostridiales Family XIII bacterium]
METLLKIAHSLSRALLVEDRWKLYLRGLELTLMIAAVACAIGIAIGILVASAKVAAQGSRNPVLRALNLLCEAYTTVIRGTPLVVQLLILYSLAAIPNGLTACFIGFGLNSGAYVSEIFRSGIQSVDIGQTEAGRSLGLSRGTTMRFIILPQAVKNVLPALFNEFIALVKETSIAGYIAVNELTKMANNIKSRTYDFTPFLLAAILYLILTFVLTRVQKRIERRFARSDKNS